MSSYFISPLRVEQIDDELWQLTEPLVYYSQKLQRSLAVPAGFVTDFASVPRLPFVYWLLGGRASKAAVIHDLLYRIGSGVSRADADAILVEAMEATGQAPWRRRLMWQGLRIGGNSSYQKRALDWKGPAMNTTLQSHLLFCLLIVTAMLVAGCAMSPEQIKAFNEGKDSKSGCFWAKGPGWETMTVYTGTDAGVVAHGGVNVGAGCSVTYANSKTAPK